MTIVTFRTDFKSEISLLILNKEKKAAVKSTPQKSDITAGHLGSVPLLTNFWLYIYIYVIRLLMLIKIDVSLTHTLSELHTNGRETSMPSAWYLTLRLFRFPQIFDYLQCWFAVITGFYSKIVEFFLFSIKRNPCFDDKISSILFFDREKMRWRNGHWNLAVLTRIQILYRNKCNECPSFFTFVYNREWSWKNYKLFKLCKNIIQFIPINGWNPICGRIFRSWKSIGGCTVFQKKWSSI